MRGEGGPSWGRLDEIAFLESLYDLDGLASQDSRFTTARGDIGPAPGQQPGLAGRLGLRGLALPTP
ncbi:hypothetical protein OG194_11480 [Streptomyces sp. NBC_01288]|uniref:AbiJ-related protein n=1 Tax=Streptomyces sp. NBC_01288 TaxID=2903814 RepID=UPI002E166766|nr:hypothetical protein OG194_11480 [Streptomyces sp. NBC_01288]